MKKNLFILFFASITVSACGEFSYKRGATASDLEQAKKICNTAGDEQKAEACMKEKGWSVQKLDDIDLFATASYSESNPNQVPDDKKKEVVKATESSSTETQAIIKKEPNPLDTYTISSWWKLGGNPQNLEVSINECVSKLGKEHMPNTKTQQVTRGLAICMRGKGWRGLKAQ